jgi:hypothetical protein
MRLAAEQAATTTAAEKNVNKAVLAQLRKELDDILEYQADRAPSWVSLEGSEHPEREGSLKDLLAAREMFGETGMPEEDEEVDEEDDDDVAETSDEKTVDVQTDLSLGMGGASIPLEGTVAVEKKSSECGDEHVIAEKLLNLTLDQEIKETLPAKFKAKSNVKAEEMMSVKNLVASPQKEQSKSNSQALSNSHWRPWE